MIDAAVGRLLAASLHQGIADVLPTRLEFYEAWLSPSSLHEGRVGLAPLAAVLGFLRLEGDHYHLVVARSGEYAADWTIDEQPQLKRSLIIGLPEVIRVRLVMRLARTLIRNTCGGNRAVARWRRGRGAVTLGESIFCQIRGHVDSPLCQFYAAAVRRLMSRFGLDVDVETERCRATGAEQCVLTVLVRPASVAA